MKRMRFLVAILIIWLFFFYNIERLSAPIDITDVAYTFVPFMAALVILAPRLHKIPLWALLLVFIPLFLALKTWVKSRVWGASLPLTVTEVGFIAVTIILAYWVRIGVGEFERAITNITIGQSDALPEPFSTGQAGMYQEVRRARHHRRPLALISIVVEKQSIQIALDRMVREAQQTMMKQYVMSDVAKTLCDKLENYDIVARRNDHFLILLPEVTPGQLPGLTKQLRQVVSEQTGVTLQISTASFPEDAMTFEGLMEKASGKTNVKRIPEHSTRPQSLATEGRKI